MHGAFQKTDGRSFEVCSLLVLTDPFNEIFSVFFGGHSELATRLWTQVFLAPGPSLGAIQFMISSV